MAGVEDRLGAANEKDAAGFERFEKIGVELRLCLFGEINDDVAAENQVEIIFKAVFEEVVAFEVDGHFNFGLNGEFAVGGLREIFCLAVGTHGANLFGGVNAALCLADDFIGLPVGLREDFLRPFVGFGKDGFPFLPAF